LKLQQLFLVVLLFVLQACGGGGSSSNSGDDSNGDDNNSVGTTVEGRAIDGPLSGSLVFMDLNGNVIKDDNETSATSDSEGYFSISTANLGDISTAKLVVIGGTDTSTNIEMDNLVLMSDMPSDLTQSVSVTPISSIVASVDTAEEKAAVLSALNIDKSVDEFLAMDPWELAEQGDAEGQRIQQVNQQVAVMVSSVQSIAPVDADPIAVSKDVFEALAKEAEEQAEEQIEVDFSSQSMLDEVIQEALPTVDASVVTAASTSLVEINQLIASEADITSISAADMVEKIQTEYQELLSDVAHNDSQAVDLDQSFEDSDNDGIANLIDDDDDNDSVPDDQDYFPLDGNQSANPGIDNGSGDSGSGNTGSDNGSDQGGSNDQAETPTIPVNFSASSVAADYTFSGVDCLLTKSGEDSCQTPTVGNLTQAVYVSSVVNGDSQKVVTISYESDSSKTTGLGLKVHFNSSQMTLSAVDTLHTADIVSAPSVDLISEDTSNSDNDSSTDSLVIAAWASLYGNFPGDQKADLFRLTFDINEDAGSGDTGSDDTGSGDTTSTEKGPAQFTEAFGGTTINGELFTFPAAAESWGGFANMDLGLYPFVFSGGGSITFTAAVPSGGSADVKFRFEKNPHPDVDPAYDTATVTVNGAAESSYSVNIPSQGNNNFRSLIMYIVDRDEAVQVSNLMVTEVSDPDAGDSGSGDTGSGDTGSDDTGSGDTTSTEKGPAQFTEAFGGTTINGELFTFPAAAESWGGFANMDLGLYPFVFSGGGSITFTAAVPSGGSADVKFRFEKNPHPDVDPAYDTATVTVNGAAESSYSVNIPSQGNNNFRSFIMYVVDRDVAVQVSNLIVTEISDTDSGDTGSGDTGGGSDDNSGDGGNNTSDPNGPAPTPTEDAANVLSIFSDSYTDISNVNFNPAWGQATTVTVADGEISYVGLNYQGTTFGGPQDVSGYEYFHIDVLPESSTTLQLYLINSAVITGGGPVETYFDLNLSVNQWNSIDIPLSSFSAVVDLTQVDEIKIVGTGNVTLDNLYFGGVSENNNGGSGNGGDTGSGDTGGADPVYTPADGFVITEAFGGTTIGDGTLLTFPTGAESWAGFANMNTSLYPISISQASIITFTAAIPAGGSADVRFRFEKNPHPDVDPAFDTASVTVIGDQAASYSISVPSQGNNAFRSFIVYLDTRDVAVEISDIVISVDPDGGDTGSGDTGSGDTGSGDTGSGDTGSGDTGSGDTGSGGDDFVTETVGPANFIEDFGGTVIEGDEFTHPSSAESWAGIANMDLSLYPFNFADGGSISFTGAVPSNGSANVKFKFEFKPSPDVEPSYTTEFEKISGSADQTYTIQIPSQGIKTFSNLILYIQERDTTVKIANLMVTTTVDPNGGNGIDAPDDYNTLSYGAGSIGDAIYPSNHRCKSDYGYWVENAGVISTNSAVQALGCNQGTGIPTGNITKLYPQLTGPAASKPTQTHKWWGSISFLGEMTVGDYDDSAYITPDPISARINNKGARVGGIPSGLRVTNPGQYYYPIGDHAAEVFDGIAVGNSAYSNLEAFTKNYSEGSVTVLWKSGSTDVMEATFVHGSPYVYFKAYAGNLEVRTLRQDGVGEKGTFSTPSNMLGIWTNVAGAINNFLIVGEGSTSFPDLSSNKANPMTMGTNGVINSAKEMTLVYLPHLTAGSVSSSMINQFASAARNKVAAVNIDYAVDSSNNEVTVTHSYVDEQGAAVDTIAGMHPLHWKNASQATTPYQIRSARGTIKFAELSQFSYQIPYVGVLPTMPTIDGSFDQATLAGLVTDFVNQGSNIWNTSADGDLYEDTYWSGKNYGKVAEVSAIARSIGMTS
jgi:hypothetical protein